MNVIRLHALAVGAWSFAAFLPFASAQIGPEFQINTYTTNNQHSADVAVDGTGNFVVVWERLYHDGSGPGVFGQRYDSAGNALGGEFQINSYTSFRQGDPAVATDAAGNFVVVWESYTQDGSVSGIFGQRYDSAGAALGVEFQVNTYTFSYQVSPTVAADAAGDFVVVWSGSSQDGSGAGIFGQRYDNTGTAVGTEFQVNAYTTFSQSRPAIVADAAGSFVVAWQSDTQDGSSFGIFAQRYDSAGTAVGTEFQVNTYTTAYQFSPAVTADAAGGFVVVWQSDTQDGNAYGVFGQRYDSAGTAVGAEFQVNTYTTSDQTDADIAIDAAGNLTVVWHSDTQDASEFGVFGQRYDSAGAAVGPEFQVNTFTPGSQFVPAVAADAAGNFVVVWTDTHMSQDGNGSGIFGQRYDAAGRQSVLGKLVRLLNPAIGMRRVKVSGRERRSYSGPIGDPLTYGATVEVIAHGDVDQNQTFSLPPGAAAPNVPGWTPADTGWMYEDDDGVNGPVVRATVRKLRRYFLVEAVIAGTASTPSPGVSLVPPGNGTDAGFVFTVLGPGGATYCVDLGGANGGTVNNTATRFIVRRATTETGCPAP